MLSSLSNHVVGSHLPVKEIEAARLFFEKIWKRGNNLQIITLSNNHKSIFFSATMTRWKIEKRRHFHIIRLSRGCGMKDFSYRVHAQGDKKRAECE